MGDANFDTYVVFLPGACECVVSGYEPVRLLALDEQDAIKKACENWYGHAGLPGGDGEGVVMVALAKSLNAYDVGPTRGVEVQAMVSLPIYEQGEVPA